MPQPTPMLKMTPEEYLDWEQTQAERHEYVAGEVFAMSGASRVHQTIVGSVFAMLDGHLRAGPCRAYVSGLKVRIRPEGPFYYPDVFVTCDERDLSNDGFQEFPRLIVEVLSPSTEAFDRGLKFEHFASISTLEEYVLIDSERQRVSCFRRGEGMKWVLQLYGPAADVSFECLGLSCSMDAIYRNVQVGPA